MEFSYDALDRRAEKRVWRHNSTPPVRTVFEWSGMRLYGERNNKVPLAHTLYLYEEGSWQPLARVDSYRGDSVPQQRVLYYHSQPNGFAPCLTNSEGEIVWRGRMQLWGMLRTEENRESYSMHPAHNLRFAGQYLDRETGLHYNTFRYYAPESGRFTQLDPVGLRGGLNLYAYVPNPLSWIDPLGLKCGEVAQPEWTPHNYKHFPPKNKSWKDIIKSTKTGPAKYTHNIDIKTLEYDVFNTGMPATNGKPWKVKNIGKVIGASEGKESQWMRVELSGGTIHGHPISIDEFRRLTAQ